MTSETLVVINVVRTTRHDSSQGWKTRNRVVQHHETTQHDTYHSCNIDVLD